MGEINRNSGTYGQMVREGVSVMALIPINYQAGRWMIRCVKRQSVSRDTARSAVAEYLYEEFAGKHMHFSQHKDDGPNHFTCSFTTFAI